MRGYPHFSFWIPITLAKIYFFPIVITFAKIHLYEEAPSLSNIPHISMVYWLNKPRGMLEEHEKRFIASHEPKASDL